MRFRKFSFILCVIYILMLWGCAGNRQNDTPPSILTGTEESQPTTTPGEFTLRDFAGIIPGRSSTYDAEKIYGEYGHLAGFDLMRWRHYIPYAAGGAMEIISYLPEQTIYTIVWYAGKEHKGADPFTSIDIDSLPNPDISAFYDVIPGKTNYKEISEICQQDLGEFPRDKRLFITIPVLNNCFVLICLNQKGTVYSIDYYCNWEDVQASHTFEFYDFYQNTPGQSTFAQIDALALEKGFLLGRGDIQPPNDEIWLVLPAEKRNRITIIGTWSDDKIQSIELCNVLKGYSGETEEIAVEMSSDIVVSLMTNITPPHDTYEKIEEICGHDFGSFPREKGLVIRIPMENACEFIVRIHRDGSVVSLQWKSIDWESEGD